METSDKPKVNVTIAAAGRLLFRRVMTILAFAVVGFIIVYASLASTIIRVLPATNIEGITVVKENTFTGGMIPAGEHAIVNPHPGADGEVKTGFSDRLLQGILPNSNASRVEILAGPYGDIEWMETGLVQVDGELMDVSMEAPETADGAPKEHLSGEYLVRCIEGLCEPGEGLIVSVDNFYGLPVEDFPATTEEEQS